jgi:uncharacterized membrane protein
MQSVIAILKSWQPHPFVDHFTVALILVGIVTDLFASIFSARLWIRYMALSLMILGALAAWGSNVTGGWEAERVWDSVVGPGKDVLQRHAWWGDILPWVFAGLALWRLGAQFTGFIAATRPIYLLAAIVAGALIVYQGHLGSMMVYDYAIGSAAYPSASPTASSSPLAAQPSPESPSSPTSIPSETASPIPSITPAVPLNPSASPSPSPTPLPATPSSASPLAIPTESATPSAGNSATPSEAPSSESTSPASPTPKDL